MASAAREHGGGWLFMLLAYASRVGTTNTKPISSEKLIKYVHCPILVLLSLCTEEHMSQPSFSHVTPKTCAPSLH
jgi:hypothetical protein